MTKLTVDDIDWYCYETLDGEEDTEMSPAPSNPPQQELDESLNQTSEYSSTFFRLIGEMLADHLDLGPAPMWLQFQEATERSLLHISRHSPDPLLHDVFEISPDNEIDLDSEAPQVGTIHSILTDASDLLLLDPELDAFTFKFIL